MNWIAHAIGFLGDSQLEGGPWGYRQGGAAYAEPTALAALALRVHGETSREAAAWLSRSQQGDGSLSIGPGRVAPRWPTSLAILAWMAEGGYDAETNAAVSFLLGLQGEHWGADDLVGHDTSIVGWPWVAATHSWVEPTSYAICALRRTGYSDHARVRSGLSMLLNRVVEGGGWNYGNTTVLGSNLYAYPGPTGIALLATLPDLASETRIAASVEWLAERPQDSRSPISLSWTLLGLVAAERTAVEAPAWLEASYERMKLRELRVSDTALLLLAARAEQAVPLLGGKA